ncbi:hypothetical protein [Nostoc sp.]|uniref:hypothetical protein n=1 Tax=Nostoc sp. TaxID=1180 RepID=UPI002FFC0D84
MLQVVSPRVGGSLRQALRVTLVPTLVPRYRCANSSRSWEATAVDGFPGIKQVAWKPPTALP